MDFQSHLPTILVFLKAPRLGTVKTRLAASTSDQHALEVYRFLAVSQLERIPPAWPVEIHFAPTDAQNEMEDWLGLDYRLYPQTDGNLGDRLSNAVENALSRGARNVICIGADCPALGTTHFNHTYSLIRYDNDVVFGPCTDGGYYLIAMSQLHPTLFQNIPWSAPDTLAVSLRHAEEANLKVVQTPPLFDIDDFSHLQRAIDAGLCPRKLLPVSE